MNLARCSLVPAALLGLATAQESRPGSRGAGLQSLEERVLSEVRAGLRSADHAQIAWASWHAGGMRLSPLAFEVERTLLRLVQGPKSRHRDLVASALCDALISLDAELLPKTFHEAWEHEPFVHEALMVLVARRPRDHLPQLRAIVAAKEPDRSWLCACNLLLELDPKALTAALLDWLAIEVRFRALDPGVDPDMVGWDDMDSMGVGTSIRSIPPEFPPIPQTSLDIVTRPDATDRILARGPVHIAWSRRTERGQLTQCTWGRPPIRVADRAVTFLVHLADAREQATQLEAVLRRGVPWQDATRWKAECQELLALLRAQWNDVTAGLQTKGLLPATSKPDVLRVHVGDGRTDQTTPLPKIE